MLLNRCLSPLFLMAALLIGIACTRPGVEASRRVALRTLIEDWKGKSFADFLKATSWNATYDSGYVDKSSFHIVEFEAFGPAPSVGSENSMTCYHMTEWTDGKPGSTTTGGANQPLGLLPMNATIQTETIRIPESRSGCKLIVWVDAKGLISSWRTEGGDCFMETMDRLKQPQ
jgi:hypothetical protein